ncbi:metal-dependent hydrolase [Natrinema sp. 1APR25-10V2]|uniref:metal-dependent hydrolase n=1 Tax=Natrinema sp. 1APR25-10V2 TaxID=2951081 RepID=UPI00287613A2|nr:metal-dependent hydrolase [Natrinema sp. 1APR25-10V2]MDS0478401.1 metal-dependent hydrolase [Natrinema sp. 1APR25-10V2]
MWPWEHLIVSYILYSLISHTVFRESPSGLDALAVVLASVLPDLIDKPLAWEYGIFDVGYAIGHSIFFAVPLAILVGMIANVTARPRTSLAFGLSYLLHPPADIIDAVFRQGVLLIDLAFWPVTLVEGHPPGPSFFEAVFLLFGHYTSDLLAGNLSAYLRIQVGLAGFTILVWLLDGAPVLRECLQVSTRAVGVVMERHTNSSSQNQPNRW